jgi:hypothetical protein
VRVCVLEFVTVFSLQQSPLSSIEHADYIEYYIPVLE